MDYGFVIENLNYLIGCFMVDKLMKYFGIDIDVFNFDLIY